MQLKLDQHTLNLIISGRIQNLHVDSFSARKGAALAHKRLAEIKLTTDQLDNETVNQFYLFFRIHQTSTYLTSEGNEMNEYTKGLQDFSLHEQPCRY